MRPSRPSPKKRQEAEKRIHYPVACIDFPWEELR